MKFLNVLYILSCITLGSSCLVVKPVQVTSVDNIKSVNTISEPELNFDLGIRNPNNFGITVKNMELSLYNGDTELAGINLVKKSKISANQSMAIPVSMRPSMTALKNLLQSEIGSLLNRNASPKMEIRGEIVMRKFLFTKKVKLKEPIRF